MLLTFVPQIHAAALIYSPSADFLCSYSHISIDIRYMCIYHTGEKLVNFMVEPKKGTKWPKELPKFTSRQEAIGVCKDLCAGHFMHRSEKVGKGELEVG